MPDKSLTLTHREMWELCGISERRFYELKAAGVFDHLISPIPFRYSRSKVEQWLAQQPTRPFQVSA